MTITEATANYEAWLSEAVGGTLKPADLAYKHGVMSDPADPFPFFRGTYYRWAQRWPAAAGALADAPRVLAVADLHADNFGTWRDADGRLCWGVNDFDEAAELPYTHDLVRLAASVRAARQTKAVAIKPKEACAALLDGYRAALESAGRPFVLEEENPQLRALALAADGEPSTVWAKLTKLRDDAPAIPPPGAVEALTAAMPGPGLVPDYRVRSKVGVGSLGRPRYAALAKWAGGWVCREAKAAAPPASAWAEGGPPTGASRSAEAVANAVRSPDPFYRPLEGWVVRRLGPRSGRIGLAGLTGGDAGRLLTAMGAETANVHLGTPGAAAAILADLAARPAGWLEAAAKALFGLVEEDWAAWRAG